MTVTDSLSLPPGPEQERTKVEPALNAPVEAVPLVALLPDQAPLAVQVVALAADQDRVDAAPLATDSGFAVSETVGAGGVTVTVVDWAALPPGPVQLRLKVVVAARLAVLAVPLAPRLPLQPPEAVQPVAFVEDQVSRDVLPLAMVVGLAPSVTVGVTFTVAVWAAVPPGPLHVRV